MRAQKCGLTNLTELSVGDQESTESLETVQSLVGILFAILLGDGDIGFLGITGGDVLSLPDKFLQQLTLVLGQEQLLGLVDDVAQVLQEDLAIVGELLRGRRQSLGRQGTVQGDIALLVLYGEDARVSKGW